jgi:hypothetical protein
MWSVALGLDYGVFVFAKVVCTYRCVEFLVLSVIWRVHICGLCVRSKSIKFLVTRCLPGWIGRHNAPGCYVEIEMNTREQSNDRGSSYLDQRELS